MRQNTVPFGAVLLAIVLLAGCAGSREVVEAPRPPMPAGFPNHNVTEVRQAIATSGMPVRAFTAKASVSASSPEQSGRFSAEIRARRDDSLYMDISPGLGINAARVLVTPDSVYLYNRIQNELLVGSLEGAAGMLAIPVESGQIFDNLVGTLVPETEVSWTIASDSTTYTLTDPSGTRIYTVDPAYWRVIRYIEQTENGETIEEREFSDFDTFEGVFLPRRVVLNRPTEDTRASIYYRSIDVNPSKQSFDLRVSRDADRRPVD